MYKILNNNPVEDISFGDATNLTLDLYYNILKAEAGRIKAPEYLQLKLVSSPLDLSAEPGGNKQGGYLWNSRYRLLQHSDTAVYPGPISGQVHTSATDLTEVYGTFLKRLRQYVVTRILSHEEQVQLANLDKKIKSIRSDMNALSIEDWKIWREYAEDRGYDVGDQATYVHWSGNYGNLRDIQRLLRNLRTTVYEKNSILDREYPNQDDRAVVDAEFEFENPAMRLRYPIFLDSEYTNGMSFSPEYLANLPLGSSGVYDDRHVIEFDPTIQSLKTKDIGSFIATLESSTQKSNSLESDWNTPVSMRYGFIKVRASASESESIKEDFKKGIKISLSAKSSVKVKLVYPSWFSASLFEHKRVKENPHDFEDFFGETGTLLYYPTHLVVVRGFTVKFESSQKWNFDYKRRFQASGGGGFRVFGINFGSSYSYSKNVNEHKVVQSNTTIEFSDDQDTLRFVGLVVKKNTVFQNTKIMMKKALGAVD